MTQTHAALPVPQVVFDLIAKALIEAGYPVMRDEHHKPACLVMTGISLIPDGNHHSPDMLINSGRFSDYEVALGEEAFGAGFDAGVECASGSDHAAKRWEAWSNYTPSEDLLDMQDDL